MIIKSNKNVYKNYFGEGGISKIYAGENLVFGHEEPKDYSKQYLALTAITDTNLGFYRNMATADIQYSSNGKDWTEYSLGKNDRMTLPAGETLYFKGNNTSITIGNTGLGYFQLNNINQQVKVSGNAMSLIYGDNFENQTTIPANGLFGLFANCYALVSAENLALPATTLANYCYSNMFENCKNLITAPELPATTLANYCYQAMFANCTSLTTTPVLPATFVYLGGYYRMFEKCTSLITAPELPATGFRNSAYGSMFKGCTSLTTPPSILPASTNTDKFVYSAMFKDCTSLTTAPVISQIKYSQNIFGSMFEGCTSLNYIKYIGTSPLTSVYHTDWVKNVSSMGTFVMNKDATWDPEEYRGVSGIPEGWTVIKE